MTRHSSPPTFRIARPSRELQAALQAKIDTKTKPLGALGELETLALRLGLIQQTPSPRLSRPAIAVFAGDHGIAAEGVSAYPSEVTAQMVLNFLAGGAAINVFARANGIELTVVDAGVDHAFAPHPHLVDAKIGRGTRNFLREPAMSAEQCALALARGAEIVSTASGAGTNVIGFGEMGIGNTSSAAALAAIATGAPISACVGRGTGLDDAGLARKQDVLERALERHAAAQAPLDALAAFGGFEIAMMAGAMLRAAELRMVLLVDGFIATAALATAARLHPETIDYCVFSHRSSEHGHALLLRHLGARPLLDLGLRLGEGTGAALAYPLLVAAASFLNEMASFDSAGVSGKTDAPPSETRR
jgi:nicotinate-nucleotide--dimethylbenzimidazole phosphoribosyltransferase